MEAKKRNNGNILTEIQAPKEYADKFTGKEYKGSKFGKKTEVDVENQKIKKVSTNTSLILETQKENGNTLDFGLQNFTYDITSEIKSTKNEENKLENVQLVKELSEKLKFIKSDDLMKSLLLKEQEKDSELDESFEENEDFTKIVKKEENEKNEEKSEIELFNLKKARKLAWEGSISKSWIIAHSNILGQTVSLKYELSLSDGTLSNTISVSCGVVTLSYGNKGTSKNKNKPEKSTGDIELFKIPFPGTPIVTFSFKVGGSIGYDVYYDIYKNKFSVSLTGELYAKAELGAGISEIVDIEVGAKGTLISLTAESTLTKISSYSYTSSNSIYVSGGTITCYIIGELLDHEIINISKDFLSRWSKRLY